MKIENFVKASKVVKALQKLIDDHGDLPICADDPDTGYRLPIGVIHKPKKEELPERFEIQTDYNGDPKGFIKN